MDNLELYNKVRTVPENALKPFKNGTFSGTDINTMWRIKKLTEEFGVCGVGWYVEIIREWSEKGVKDEVLAFVEIKLYIKVDKEWSKGISATGGSKIVKYFTNKDYSANNDEGYKMAATDALGVACKFLGFGADVYWKNDKTKYTNDDDKKEQEEIKHATEAQVKRIKELVKPENIIGMCNYYNKQGYNITKELTDIPNDLADYIIRSKEAEYENKQKA